MSYQQVKHAVRDHTDLLVRQRINRTYGTRISVTTNGTIVRANLDELNVSQSSSSTTSTPRWS